MPSVSKAARQAATSLAGSLACLVLTVAPVAAFARLMRAEGPLPLLFGWAAVSALLLRGALRIPERRRLVSATVRTLALIVVAAGMAIVLVQVNVARRSLAEAWLDLARKGEAFGFFSFFATEVYALFALGQTAFLSARKPLSWIVSAAASNALCFGIVFGNGAALALAVAATVALALSLNDGPLRYRLVSLSTPFVLAAAISLFYSWYRDPSGARLRLPAPPDLTGLITLVAPGFPLLVDVPGYGFSAGSGSMPSSVFLTTRPLWSIQGRSGTTHYLADGRYDEWLRTAWAPDPDPGPPVAALAEAPLAARRDLLLTLAEDFFPSAPIERETEALAFPDGIPRQISASKNAGARFEPSLRRGQRVILLSRVPAEAVGDQPDAKAPATDSGFDDARYLDASRNSPRLRALAADLLRKAGEGAPSAADDAEQTLRRRYVALLLDHFASGYEYSLDAGKPPEGKDTVDWFVFDRRKGFCVYYASAFVLLAREAGIPARMAEGWRVTLGENGTGTITGSNAHAWPELYLDGDWRIFEPTPPYAQADPFAYTREGDRATRRQLEDLYGQTATAVTRETPGRSPILPPYAALGAAVLAILLLGARFALTLAAGERGRVVREARKAVKKAARRGIPRPEQSGWLAWKAALPTALPEASAAKAALLADRMIAYVYGESGGTD